MIQDLPWWSEAMARLRQLHDARGTEAARQAKEYADVYRGRRAAMVVDVVGSRQRSYGTRVKRMVAAFEAAHPTATLADLAESGPGDGLGLRPAEPVTMQSMAAGLTRFAEERGLDEESGVRAWADWSLDFDHAPGLDPYVGVKGVGVALYTYMRMRCGGDAIKPDVRVMRRLNELGFRHGGSAHGVLVVAAAAAAEIGVNRLVLDQLLWLAPAGTQR